MYDKTLDTFLAVAETGSFSQAAARLFVSHTAVMKQMNGLEGQLGVRLFDRSRVGVSLTAAGECLVVEARRVIETSDQAMSKVQATQGASPTTIRIGTSSLHPCEALMDLWHYIADRNPRFRLQVVPFGGGEPFSAGLGKDYDLVTGPFSVDDKDLQFVSMGTCRSCIAMPRAHRLAVLSSVSLDDLAGERLMLMRFGASPVSDRIRAELDRAHADTELVDIEQRYDAEVFNRCARGDALLLSLNCWKDVHPSLATVSIGGSYEVPYGIMAPAQPTDGVARFLDVIRATLSEHGAREGF